MIDEFIDDKMIKTVKRIVLEDPNVVFCGSFGLVLNEKLLRKVKDIDILTPVNYYGNPNDFFLDERTRTDVNISESHKFMVGKDQVFSFKVQVYGVSIDVLYNDTTHPKFYEHEFHGIMIKVETPESAIRAKKLYVVNDKSQYSVIKHLKDLIFMGIDKHELIELIDSSYLVEDPKKVKKPTNIDTFGEDDLPF